MIRRFYVTSVCFFVLVLLASLSSAQGPQPKTIEMSIPGLLRGPFVPDSARQAELNHLPEWLNFVSSIPGKYWVTWNEKRQTPHVIIGGGITLATPINAANAEAVCKSFLLRFQSLLKLNPLQIELESVRNYERLWHVIFQQKLNGIAVHGGRARVTVNANNQVVLFGSDFFPEVDISTSPTISEDAAIGIAQGKVNWNADTDWVRSSSLLIVPIENDSSFSYRLAWRFKLHADDPFGEWLFFIDAHSGEFIYITNEIRSYTVSGTVTGIRYDKYPTDTPVSVPFKANYVSLYNILGQFVGTKTTDANGYYEFTNLAVGSYYVKSKLKGPYVDVQTETVSGGTEAQHSGSFSWEWSGSNVVYNDEPNVFYYINEMHDWIKGSPFNFDGMDYQMKAVVQDVIYPTNAWYDPASKNTGYGGGGVYDATDPYWQGTIYYGIWTFNNMALNTDVIRHEYTHGIIDHIYSSPLDNTVEEQSMNEGFADYFACTRDNDPDEGEGTVDGDDPWARHLDTPDLRVPDDWDGSGLSGDEHWNGQIISGAAWDFRNASGVGASIADILVFDALNAQPRTFVQFVDQLIIADDNRYGDGIIYNGTPHFSQIVQAFENNHGISPTIPQPPAAPQNLVANNADGGIQLNWSATSETVGYYIYRSTTSGFTPSPANRIGETGTNQYLDTSVQLSTTYYYRVSAYNAGGESGYSNQASQTTPGPLTVSIDGPDQLGYKQSGTYTAIISGGSGSYSCAWLKNDSGDWYYYAWGNPIQASGTKDFYLKVEVDDDQTIASGTATKFVHVGLDKKFSAGTETVEPPKTYDLAQNYPNPFNPITEIKYQVPKLGHVSLKIYNLMGQEVRTLVEGEKATGYYTALWDAKDNSGNDVASGVYIYRIVAGDYTQIRKMILIR